MNIGFDAKRLFNNFTGLGNYSRNLLLNLAEFYPEHQYHLYSPKVKQGDETATFFTGNQFTVHSPNSFKPLWRSYGVKSCWERDELDVYHGLSNEIPFGKSSVKRVVTIHDLIFKHYPETYKAADRIIYDAKFKYACRNVDQVVAISQQTKEDIIRFYGIEEKKISVVYQSCHPLFYSNKTEEELNEVKQRLSLPDRFLLSVGSIIERKNLLLVVKALALLKPEERIPLVIVGSGGAYMEKVQAFALQAGFSDLLIWKNNLRSNTDLQALYQLSEALVYPSICEGFGIPLVEGMLSGTPVITSNVSCLPETIGEAGFKVDPADTEQLAFCLRSLLEDKTLRDTWGQKGREFALERYSRKKLTDDQMSVYFGLK